MGKMIEEIPVPRKICNYCGFSTTCDDISAFNYCPRCARPALEWQGILRAFFERAHLSSALKKAIIQFDKGEFESAARTALIAVEEKVREKTKLSSGGADLFAKAFSCRIDPTGAIIEKPLIQINDLTTEEDRNEQEGIKLLCMGMTRGIRNLVAHHDAELHPMSCLSILMLCNLVLDLVTSGSILKERVCVWTRVSNPSMQKKRKKVARPKVGVRRSRGKQ